MEGDGWAGAGAQTAAFTPADGPVTAVGTHRDGALPVDGLPGRAQIPVCFISNLRQSAQNAVRREATQQESKQKHRRSFNLDQLCTNTPAVFKCGASPILV